MIPSVLPPAPAGPRTDRQRRSAAARSASRWRVTVTSRSCRHRSCPPACSTRGDCPPTTRGARTTAVLNPLEADRPQLATTLLPALLEALGRNVSRGAVDVALFAIAQVVQPTDADPGASSSIPIDRRPTDDEIATLDASLPRQPQHVAAVLTGLREPARPVGAGPAGRGRRRVRGGPDHRAAHAGSRCTLRAAQLPAVASRAGAPRCSSRRHVGRARRAAASRRDRAGRPAEGHLRGRAQPRRDSRSSSRCRRRGCRRSRRCSRTSAWSSATTSPRRRSSMRSATAPANCSRTCSCSTSTPARRSARTASR